MMTRSYKLGCCILIWTTTLWAQFYGQPQQQTMGQIPNNGEISGLARQPNPMDSSHNWVMTGNVTGGKHFHGNVPYRASGELNIPLGSSALDGFKRYASPMSTSQTGMNSSYYATSRTASHMIPGNMQMVTPAFPQVTQRPQWQDTTAAIELSDLQTLYPTELTPVESQPAVPDASMSLGAMATLAPTDQETLASESSLSQPLTSSLERPWQEQAPSNTQELSTTQSTSTIRPWQQEQPVPTQPQDPLYLLSQEAKQVMEETQYLADDKPDRPIPSEMSVAVPSLPTVKDVERLGSTETLALMQEPMGSADSASQPGMSAEQTLSLLHGARDHLQQGHPQEALAIYQRIACWRPRDPAVLAGQCLANLAQGHLMSSALYLSRWLEAEPESLTQTIDLPRSVGGAELLAQRVQEVEDYLAISEMAELYFLRAFIHLKTGQLEPARSDIEAAVQLKPNLKGVDCLQAALNS